MPAIIAMLLSSLPANAQVLYLSCDGTQTGVRGYTSNKSERVTKLGVIVNLTENTVAGLLTTPADITQTSDAKLLFNGIDGSWIVTGEIDRVAGFVWATTMLHDIKTGGVILANSYELVCNPTQRLF
jgi:hypothetical protein